MKKRYIAILALMIVLIFSINIYAEGKNKTSDLLLFSNKVNNNKDVFGDIYAFAQDIYIENIVDGDVISIGQDITVNSDIINGNIRLVGQSISINVNDTNNITVAGQTININNDTNCNKIYVASQDFRFQGQANDLYVKAQDIVIDGTINNNLDIECENVIISENAKLLGDINIKSPNKATVYGNHNLDNVHYEKTIFKEVHHTFRVMPILTSFISAIVIGTLIFILFKKYFNTFNNGFSINIGKYLLCGLCIFIIFPILFLLLCISVIGIPIAIILLILYILVLYISHIIVGIILGKYIFKRYNIYLQIILGICLIKILIYIPIIGFLLGLCTILFTLGLITLNLISLLK